MWAWGFVGTNVEGVDKPQVVDILHPVNADCADYVIQLENGSKVEANCDEMSLLTYKHKLLKDFGELKAGDEVYSTEDTEEDGTIKVSRRDGLTLDVPEDILEEMEHF